ncbi:MAG TPA: peptide-N4-asparagine amidase [Xanthomonadaceae bacterium]|nr:peptide-N4-asparagine amidase [Xanthomonadaceae bacterium]
MASPAAAGVGSGNVTVADPTVPRPHATPCVVQLFSNDTFDDFGTRPFGYSPPAGCSGKWSKVVLEADFSVTAGVQYDRTATIFLDGVNLYFGTTQEPSQTLAPSWHVERDLTDYAPLFAKPGQGQAIIGNLVNDTYTGVIHGSARLLFYPAALKAVRTADAVYPLGSDPVGNTVALNDSTSLLATTLSLPRNIQYAYLDVFAQSQSDDEFWYTCVPDQFADEVQECGGGNFREVEVSIDGQPAGVAPVYPWIYTGGIDPFLWEPTPGVQTLNFMPYRVDLSPFAGVLSNGASHQVALSVAGANNYFSATASLLVYLDPHSSQVSGQVDRNTLVGQSPTPTIGNTLATDPSGNITGGITTDLSRSFVIEGYADTAHGRVYSRVQQAVDFADTQDFTITGTQYRQLSEQLTTANSTSQSISNGVVTQQYEQNVQYPLHVDFNELVHANGNITLASTAQQGFTKNESRAAGSVATYAAKVDNSVKSADTLDYDANFNFLGHSGQHSTQTFTFNDSLGSCYGKSVASLNGVVTGYTSGVGCLVGVNHVFWYAHPDGSPDNVSTPGSP